MKTFILMWNPAISSYTWERFKDDQKEFCEDGWGDGVGNWSVWEHDKAEVGDRFFMVKVGEGKTGIVMAGTFTSDPYEDEDWSGKGRQTYYMDLAIDEQIDPDNIDIITTEELSKEIPDFDWSGGHSGRLLDQDSAYKLEIMWLNYLYKVKDTEDVYAVYMQNDFSLNDAQKAYMRKFKGETCEICGYNYKKVFGDDCREFVDSEIILPEENTDDANVDQDPLNMIHCICMNCREVGTNVIYRKLFK